MGLDFRALDRHRRLRSHSSDRGGGAYPSPAARSHYHDPVVTLDEWDALFNIVPYPDVSNFQGARIAPVWRHFIEETEALSAPPRR